MKNGVPQTTKDIAVDYLQVCIELATHRERERCAKVAEDFSFAHVTDKVVGKTSEQSMALMIANGIRTGLDGLPNIESALCPGKPSEEGG